MNRPAVVIRAAEVRVLSNADEFGEHQPIGYYPSDDAPSQHSKVRSLGGASGEWHDRLS